MTTNLELWRKSRNTNKYGAKGFRDEAGDWWASRLEHRRWNVLQLMQKANPPLILHVERQVRYALEVNGIVVCHMVIDFEITELDGAKVLEDAKGVITKDWSLKKKLFEAIYGRQIIITGERESR